MDYQPGSVFRSRANQLGTRTQQAEQLKAELTKRIVEFVTLYVSNDPSTYDTETADLVRKVEEIRHELSNDRPYKDRLSSWHGANLFNCSRMWFGDTSRLYYKNGQLGCNGLTPQPDWIATIHPTNHSEVLDFNLKNINSYIEQTGSFESYKQRYIEHMSNHADSVLYERKLIMDLNTAENAVSGYERMGFYGVSTRNWYESFTNRNDTLNKKDYQIWDLDQPLPELPLFSGSQRSEPPYLLHLLDNVSDVINPANAYLLHLKIPFLRELREDLLKKALANDIPGVLFDNPKTDTIPAATTELVTGSIPTETQTETVITKKSKKKEHQLTTKQQMILLNMLGFLDASIIENLSTIHRAAILAQLLNRSKQEIRGMLTYGWGTNSPKDYNCTQPDDVEKVIDFLSDNNLQV